MLVDSWIHGFHFAVAVRSSPPTSGCKA
jgi:hypothetical protein